MDFYLLRHGKTEYNGKGLLLGKTDAFLLTREDPNLLRWIERLNAIVWRAMFYSGMKRTEETLQVIRENLNKESRSLPYHTDDRLQEMNFGKWELKSYDWLYKEQQEAFSLWLDNAYHHAPPQGETLMEMKKRIVSFFEEWSEKELDGSILVVTHGGPIQLLWSMIHQTSFYEKKVEPASLFRLDWKKQSMEEIVSEIKNEE